LNVQEYISSGAIEVCIMGLATAEEQSQYQEMRQNQPEVVAYANAMEEALEQQYLQQNALAPNANTFEKIKETIAAIAVETPVINMQATAPKVSLWKQYGIAASIALLLGSTVFNFMLLGKIKKLQTNFNELAATKNNTPKTDNNSKFAFLSNPNVTPIAMYGVGSHNICKCSIFWDKSINKAYFVTHHLFAVGDNNDYQLWAMVNNKPVSMGVITLTTDGSPIPVNNIPEGTTGFYLTLEKKGGATKPTMDQMYLLGNLHT
jgi:anti-sigma-K factor RskA